MITLSLLHPIKQIPVQLWTFDQEPVIRIGRSTDNHVVLYSAVVSRHHVELRRVGSGWEVVNLGTNGTYLDGKRITQVPVTDGSVIRLARSGPNIQIRLGPEALKEAAAQMKSDRTISQRSDEVPTPTDVSDRSAMNGHDRRTDLPPDENLASPPKGTIPVPPHLMLSAEALANVPDRVAAAVTAKAIASAAPTRLMPPCDHHQGGHLFCVDCGEPLQVLQTLGDYQLIRVLGQGEVGITYHAWHQGENCVLKTLNPDWVSNLQALEALECEAELLRQLNHPQIPHVLDFFLVNDKPCLVMQMMSGQTVAQAIATQGSLSFEQALTWIQLVGQVLDYLHTFTPPLLHRSLHPGNLIYQSHPHFPDTIAVVGFGALKSIVLGGGEVQPGSTGYVAPEQMELYASPATDLYALGPLIAFLVTGTNPVSFYADRGDGNRFQADTVPGLSPAWVDVLQTLTHPNPADRYQSMTELKTVLEAIA